MNDKELWWFQYQERIKRQEVIFKWDCSICERGMDYIYKIGHEFEAKDFCDSGWTIDRTGVKCPVCSKKDIPLKELTKHLSDLRKNQPKVTLDEAREQAKRVKNATRKHD